MVHQLAIDGQQLAIAEATGAIVLNPTAGMHLLLVLVGHYFVWHIRVLSWEVHTPRKMCLAQFEGGGGEGVHWHMGSPCPDRFGTGGG